jgi:hypothetical protein
VYLRVRKPPDKVRRRQPVSQARHENYRDWPYESNRGAVEFLKRLALDSCDLEKIAHPNAERILRL